MGCICMRQIGTPRFYAQRGFCRISWLPHGRAALVLYGFLPFRPFAALMVLVVPALLACLRWFAFARVVTGVESASIITQALTYALLPRVFPQQTRLGGNNGLTEFFKGTFSAFEIQSPSTRAGL